MFAARLAVLLFATAPALARADAELVVTAEPKSHEIESAETSLRGTPATSHAEKAEALFHLAELYRHEALRVADRARAVDYQLLYSDVAAERQRLQAERRASDQERENWTRASTRQLAVLSTDSRYSTYPRLDEALYLYAVELAELNSPGSAHAAAQRLVEQYPGSPFAALAQAITK